MKRETVKRICAILLTGTMAVGSLTGCGGTEGEIKNNSESKSSESEGSIVADNTETEKKKLELDGPVTLRILAADDEGMDPDDVYIYKYLEWWLAEQGYDVTLDVTHTSSSDEWEQQTSVAFGTGELPDMGWGYQLGTTKQVLYGETDQLLLDWTPYLNEETMPNLMAVFEKVPDALGASTTTTGGVYTLPTIYDKTVASVNGDLTTNNILYINQSWLNQIGWEGYPTTVDEFLDMARAMKEYEHPEGLETWPLCDFDVMLANVLVWLPNGYCGSWGSRYGTGFTIKNGEVVMGCYEEEYRELVTLYHQMYEEGLLHPDFLTIDSTTNTAMINSGQYGVMGAWGQAEDTSSGNTFGEDEKHLNSVFVNPLTNDTGIKPLANSGAGYLTGTCWASKDTEYPELCALIVDYLYSLEGATIYQYGPQEGKDPLNLLSGWALDDNGTYTYADAGEEGAYTYRMNTMHGYWAMFNSLGTTEYMWQLAGREKTNPDKTLIDGLTGASYTMPDYTSSPSLSEWTKHFFLEERAKWGDSGNVTKVTLPSVYLSEEEALHATEMATVIKEYVNTETPKFMLGERPLEEVDEFWEELKEMGIEEYIEIYREAYAPYMESVFGK